MRKQLKTEMDAVPGLLILLLTLDSEHEIAFEPMVKALKRAEKPDGLHEEFGRWALGIPAAKSNPIMTLEAAQIILGAQLDEVFSHEKSLEEGAEEEEQHELRKSLRRVRYTLETLSTCFGKPVKPFIKTLVEMQDTLGEMQDRAVLASVVERIFGEERPEDVEEFVAHGTRRREELLEKTRSLWAKAQSKGFWDTLRGL